MTASGIRLDHGRQAPAAPSWVVLSYLVVAYWITQLLLPDWVSNPDLNFFLIQPLIWLSLAAIAYRAWGQLHWAPPLNRGWIAVAALIGVVHVAVLLIGGLVGGMASVRSEFDWLVYLENTWYVGTLLLGVETARTYLFHVWFRRSPVAAWATTVLLFFVVVTPYAQFQSLDSLDRAVEIAGASLIPALAISVLATWFAEQGGMGASLAYRAPILAFLWYSMVLPDLHWSSTLAVGVIAPVVAWNLATPLAVALVDPQHS